MALQTLPCDQNTRRNNLRSLHGTATYTILVIAPLIQSPANKNCISVYMYIGNEFSTTDIYTGPLAAKLGGGALTEASKQVGNKEVAGMIKPKDRALVCD